jgi:Na+-driven multidrug efflux pump
MFALFPILGITRFIPIAGYNHGAQNYERVKESIQISIKYAALASLILFYTLLCNAYCIRFTTDPKLLQRHRMPCVVFAASYYCHPVNRAAYFQAAGNAKKALLLTLSKQGFS